MDKFIAFALIGLVLTTIMIVLAVMAVKQSIEDKNWSVGTGDWRDNGQK